MKKTLLLATTALLLAMTSHAQPADDPYLWLEEVQGEKALAWVRERNAASRAVLEKQPNFASDRARILEILDSKDKIPNISRRGDWFYNLWQDAKNPRGLWRRTTLAEYRKAEPRWETVLDLDALGAAEKENWVWKGATCHGPDYRRCVLSLSRGGADAVVLREFDTIDKKFVDPKGGGFATTTESRSYVDWIDRDTLYIGADFGPGTTTASGYPRTIRRWVRGTALADAPVAFEGKAGEVLAWANVDDTPGFERITFGVWVDSLNSRQWLLGADGKTLQPIDYPSDARFAFWRERVLIELKSDWTLADKTWPRGSLLVADAVAYLKGERRFEALFTPTPTRSLDAFTVTRDRVLLTVLDNVAGRVEEWRADGARWSKRDVAAPFPGTLSVAPLHDPLIKGDALADQYLLSYTDFLTPDSLMLGRVGSDARETLKSRPRFFDSTGMRAEQRFATSKDGTRVPYFIVWPQGAKADGSNPTLLYGYGGFEVSMQPYYSGSAGRVWLQRRGVFVLANIRGGGEFGPGWHRSAIRENKQKSYDDFVAVAEDLIKTKVTSPKHLGIEGGSNGGLLVGAVMLQRPDLFNAVVCQVPLLDMRRFHKLLAGASWMAEYGDPDQPEDWAFLSKYSPYQNLRKDQKLPKVLLITSTRDDRVHPGHARKMAARLAEQGHEVLYYENIEGGHGGAADNAQRADMMALEYAFLWQQLAR
jgi:prolyl oligopeptidase